MFSDLKRTTALVSTGNSVLAQVPAHWSVRTMRSLITARSERNRTDLPLLSVARERGVFVRAADDDNHNVIPDDLTKYKLARKGDLVINKMKAWQGSLGLAPEDGIVSPAYYVYDFAIENRYFGEALLRSKPYVALLGTASDVVRIGQWDLSVPRFREIPVLVPPAAEQAAIVKYLGHAHARIDRAIAAKCKLIALLEEQKQAVTHQAATRGLDPSVSLKDSGIPWLGKIPAHWKVVSTRGVSRLIQTGPFGSQLHAEDYVKGGIPVINPSHLKGGTINSDSGVAVDSAAAARLARHAVELGDILVARRGELGRSAVVGEAQVGWLCGTGSLILRLREGIVRPDYYQILLSAPAVKEELESTSVGSTMANLSAGAISRMRMPIPPFEEQSEIVEAVVESNRVCDEVRERCHDEINLLREFRVRLTSDVVTGQVDVREIAATLPALTFDVLASADDEFGEDDNLIGSVLDFEGANE